MGLVKKITSNKVLQYVFSRYFIYFIQFLNSLLIAVYLGPFYLGIWGFVNLVIQYCEQLNFGISQSFNALGAIHKEDKVYVSNLFSVTLICLGILGGLTGLLFFLNDALQLGFGEKYNFSQYAFVIMIAVILHYFIPAFLSLLRIYGNISIIAIVQSIQPVLVFLTLHFWKGEALLNMLVWTFLFSFSISIVLCLIKAPIPIKIWVNVDASLIKTLLKKALYLFLCTGCFYFILLSTKGLISINYSVEQFGYFTFAFALGNAILLLFKSFVFLIFPKVINRLAHSESHEAMDVVNKARVDYVTLAHIVGHIAIIGFPIFVLLFPNYSETVVVFNLIVLSLVVYTHCFGYQELMIAKGRDRLLGYIAFFALIVNLLLAIFMIYVLKVSFEFVILSTMVAYLVFLSLLVYWSRKILDLKPSYKEMTRAIFPIRLLIPFVVSLLLSIYGFSVWFYILPIVLFIVLNKRYLLNLKSTFMRILNNPTIVDI